MNTTTAKAMKVLDSAFRVVLHQINGGSEWSTHLENLNPDLTPKQQPDFYWGHYCGNDYNAALADYKARCAKYHLHP